MAATKRPGTMVYFDLLAPLEDLNMEERGQLFTALLEYGDAEKEPVFSGSSALRMAWLFVKRDTDRDRAKYEAKCEKNRQNAKAGWNGRKGEPLRADANGCDGSERIQTDANVANSTQPNSTTTQPNSNNREKEEKESPTRRQKKFVPPTAEEVEAYCREKGYHVNAQLFVDHYEASGWMRGNTKIKDWKACVRTWVRNQANQGGKPTPQEPELLNAANWED